MKILIVIIMEIIMLVQEGAGLETLCSAVRELIHSCGDELGWCFTEDQVPVDAFFWIVLLMLFLDGASLKIKLTTITYFCPL